jgi:RNA polymerase sigma factor (sigma-70 family)
MTALNKRLKRLTTTSGRSTTALPRFASQLTEVAHFKRLEAASGAEYGDLLNEAVLRNRGLAGSIAKRFVSNTIEFDDLLQEATYGLILAAQGFNWRRGKRFATYARWWIMNSMIRYVQQEGGYNVVQLTLEMGADLQRIKKTQHELSKRHRVVTTEMVVNYILDSTSNPEVRVELEKRLDKAVRQIGNSAVPLDAEKMKGGGSLRLHDIIPGSSVPHSEIKEAQKIVAEVHAFFKRRLKRDREIFYRHYGLMGRAEETSEAIGLSMGVTRQRVNKLEGDTFLDLTAKLGYEKEQVLAAFELAARHSHPSRGRAPGTQPSPV